MDVLFLELIAHAASLLNYASATTELIHSSAGLTGYSFLSVSPGSLGHISFSKVPDFASQFYVTRRVEFQNPVKTSMDHIHEIGTVISINPKIDNVSLPDAPYPKVDQSKDIRRPGENITAEKAYLAKLNEEVDQKKLTLHKAGVEWQKYQEKLHCVPQSVFDKIMAKCAAYQIKTHGYLYYASYIYGDYVFFQQVQVGELISHENIGELVKIWVQTGHRTYRQMTVSTTSIVGMLHRWELNPLYSKYRFSMI